MQREHDTPDPIKRILRQEALFGCCRCGHPVFQYHHIIPYEAEAHFRPEDMMILCPTCHDMATRGALNLEKQRELKANPYNKRKGYASGLLSVNQQFCEVQVGSVHWIASGPLLEVDGEILLSLEVGEQNTLLLSVALYDADDTLTALIVKNEWVSGDPSPWDLMFDYRRLTIRRRKANIALQIDATGPVIKIRAEIWKSRLHVLLSSAGLLIENGPRIEMANCILVNGHFQFFNGLGVIGPNLGEKWSITVNGTPEQGRQLWHQYKAEQVANLSEVPKVN